MNRISEGQQELLVAADRSGQVVPRDFSESDDMSVSLAERNVHLQNVITTLASVSMLKGFVLFADAEGEYGAAAEAILSNAQAKLAAQTQKAKREFAHAFGYHEMIAGGMNKKDVKAATRTAFSDFLKAYFLGPNKYQKSQEYRRSLARSNDILLSSDPVVDTPMEHYSATTEKKEVTDTLSNSQKLEVLKTDPNAGFLPTTHREKTIALTQSDYTDDEGADDQLFEIYKHKQKTIRRKSDGVIVWGSKKAGVRAVESAIYEMNDFMVNAYVSHAFLTDLYAQLNNTPNPRITLSEAVVPDHYGIAILARFIDIKALLPDAPPREKGEVSIPNPLYVVERRWANEGEGRHKEVQDIYTQTMPRPEVVERIKHLAETMRVRAGRDLALEALSNEELRFKFFHRQLGQTRAMEDISPIFANIARLANLVVTETSDLKRAS